ncbi:DUF4352 domain-containing protein [Virgibacillus sp. M23]|uniref:DUF4352 domain-containing protein n=1 Tax=Virgibacillus sp. M23 TaxID=3079030 RepID=UPI002A90CAC8|nr:DUF4352 domain-containing protein [Virgibacillus sp. M23]MDY7045182.1 DUF4352 domain-containing protein [Virgibacillus sp. M23]
MKKLLVLLVLLAVIVVAGCSDNDEGSKKEKTDANKEQTTETETNDDKEEYTEDKKVYQIGEIAEIKSGLYDFPYEVTVNSFELIKEEKNGINPTELYGGELEPEESIAVANVTIKNTSDKSFIPSEKISAQFLIEGKASQNSFDQFFTERNKELAPGQEITGDLAYFNMYESNKDFQLVYEFKDSQETRFILPNPNK